MLASDYFFHIIFGRILLITAGNLLRPETHGDDQADNFMIRLARRIFHTTEHYDGDRLFTIHDGKRALTPMLLVMVAIGGTDILFALDSIPAIFGLTQNVYIVFTATAFSLMGLRQLYFLIDGPLTTTVVASLLSKAGLAQTSINNARRHAVSYLDLEYTADASERERIHRLLTEEDSQILAMDPKYRNKAKDIDKIRALVAEAHRQHEQYLARWLSDPGAAGPDYRRAAAAGRDPPAGLPPAIVMAACSRESTSAGVPPAEMLVNRLKSGSDR